MVVPDAGGLIVACLAAPLSASSGGVVLAAWIWPLLIWSQMGSREARYATGSLIFSAPHALQRQLPAVGLQAFWSRSPRAVDSPSVS